MSDPAEELAVLGVDRRACYAYDLLRDAGFTPEQAGAHVLHAHRKSCDPLYYARVMVLLAAG